MGQETETKMKNILKKSKIASSVAFIVAAGAGFNAQADTDVKLTGYIKVDALASTYSDGSLGSGSLGRDFYIPSLTPVGGDDEGTQFDSHARQSRFRITSNTDTDEGDKITGVLEFDFLVTPDGNERISNSYTVRMRHAFLKYKNWLVGQTWSTFMDVSILPESVDFIGVTDGITFARQVMVRYSYNGWEFALENPESTITPNGGGGRIVTDDNSTPDAVIAYKYKDDWGHIRLAGLYHQLAYDDGNTIDETEAGFGITLTSKVKLGNGDDIRMSMFSGSGLGRYAALNAANGGVLTETGQIEAIDSYGYSIAYRHLWNEKLRSSVMFSSFSADNDVALTGGSVTESAYSTRANLMYSPTQAITVGAEYTFAKRETEAGLEGDMNRLQLSAKYAF